MARYANIKGAKHGSTNITTVKSITVNNPMNLLKSGGDADRYPTGQFRAYGDLSGTLVIEDPVQAQALSEAASATLEFQGEAEAGGNNIKVTILNVLFGGYTANMAHNTISSYSLPFSMKSADGQTSPVDMDVVTPP